MFVKPWMFFILHLFLFESEAKRILAVFPLNEKSHNNVLDALAKGLANRGHQVDVITHFELKDPPKNYKTIVNLNGTREDLVNNLSIDYCSGQTGDSVPFYAFTAGNEICDLMGLEDMQDVIKNPPKDPPYDLVITEVFGANCYIGFGYVFKVPVITVAPHMGLSWTGDGVGSPTSTAFYADILMDIHEKQTKAMRKYLSPNIPSIREIERTVALTLVNSYHNPFGIRPLTPGMIEIGGIHIEENNTKISPDLEQWMDESSHGVIYFTLGSMVLIETLPQDALLAFYEVFEKLSPMRILIKIVNRQKLPPGLPKNIRTSSWIPQISVLKHKNTKLFISHGGMLGIQEALYYSVPMIGIPLFGDHFRVMATLVSKNIAIEINYKNITKESLTESINAIFNNKKYKQAVIRESRLYRDRPMSAINTSIFWVEYVMRNGQNTLRSSAVNMYWWQVELFDVYSFIFLICATLISLMLFMLKFIIQRALQFLSCYARQNIKYKTK